LKTQSFSDQQLKDLVAGKEVDAVEAKKKGECLYVKGDREPFQIIGITINTKFDNNHTPIWEENPKLSCEVGELVQACNEKGEKQWYCPLCKRIGIGLMGINFECGCLTLHREEDEHWNPLVVRLQKIEKKEILIGECDSGKPILEENWLKTWVRI